MKLSLFFFEHLFKMFIFFIAFCFQVVKTFFSYCYLFVFIKLSVFSFLFNVRYVVLTDITIKPYYTDQYSYTIVFYCCYIIYIIFCYTSLIAILYLCSFVFICCHLWHITETLHKICLFFYPLISFLLFYVHFHLKTTIPYNVKLSCFFAFLYVFLVFVLLLY